MRNDKLILFVIVALLTVTIPVKNLVVANDKFTPTEDDINTWRYGALILPQSALAPGAPANASHLLKNVETWAEDTAKYLKPDVKIPIVLYLHSCGGNDHYRWSETLSEWGFGVIAPNSFARDGRRKHCGTMPGAKLFNMRMSELYYALSQIKKTDWIDQTRLILMGHSEGSFFPPAYSDEDFTAHIILAGNCRFSHLGPAPCCAPGHSKAPKHIAVLNIIGDGDEWNEWACHATHKLRGSRFVKLKNHGHDISNTHPKAVEIMAKFLETCCGKKKIKNSTEGLDPFVSAKKLFDELGGMATIDVQLRADEAASKGDLEGRDFWLAVLKEVEKMVE
ncbi:MAG: hypothetical protein CMF69_05995 [Magnetovibrio sp.]|nr:hypothetical protein [Magnetovibrio sp.]|tara:strand:+ start:311 stop:1318 length:1008 start_codon:yes stop_codon:yes gene_type:complete